MILKALGPAALAANPGFDLIPINGFASPHMIKRFILSFEGVFLDDLSEKADLAGHLFDVVQGISELPLERRTDVAELFPIGVYGVDGVVDVTHETFQRVFRSFEILLDVLRPALLDEVHCESG